MSAIQRDRRLGRLWRDRQPAAELEPFNLLHRNQMMENEPPEHTRLRRPVARAFARGHVERLRPRVRELAAGLLDEVRALRARGDLSPTLPALRAVGYRQAWQALEEGWPLERLRERACAATRQLAKRQLTWLRGMPGRRRLAADAENAGAQALATLLDSLGAP